jgi:hypothetical protein
MSDVLFSLEHGMVLDHLQSSLIVLQKWYCQQMVKKHRTQLKNCNRLVSFTPVLKAFDFEHGIAQLCHCIDNICDHFFSRIISVTSAMKWPLILEREKI